MRGVVATNGARWRGEVAMNRLRDPTRQVACSPPARETRVLASRAMTQIVPRLADGRGPIRVESGIRPLTDSCMANYVLEILDGDRAGEVLPVTDRTLRIGRKPAN